MKTKYILLITLLATLSCTKLENKVYDSIPGDLYPETPAQVASLSVVTYLQLQPLADDNGWWFLAQEISSDEVCGPTRGADWYDAGKWLNMHRHTWTNDDEGVNRMWSAFWTGVTICNKILDKMNKLPISVAITAKKREVEVVRCFYYYLLIDNYGDVPYLTSFENAPAMPYKVKRATIYDTLVATITRAIPSLKPVDRKYMMNRYAAFALLGKLYLNAKEYSGTPQWQLTSDYCDSVMKGPYSLASDLSEPFKTNNENSSEIIFSIPYDEDNFTGFRLHMRTLHYQMNLKYNMTVGPWNGFCIVPTFWDTYQVIDKRRAAYNIWGLQYSAAGPVILDGETHQPLDIAPKVAALYMQPPNFTPTQIRTSGARIGKYEIKMGAKENLSNDFPLFRLTDFYLMKAEAQMRLGSSGDQWINPIRLRAGVAPWNPATLDSLLAERGRELYCEGHRRQDLIRFGVWEQAWWEKNAHGPELRTFPIPKWATDANPNLLLPPQ